MQVISITIFYKYLLFLAFKLEWVTIKDNMLYVGSHGSEYVWIKNVSIMSEDRMWIKVKINILSLEFCFKNLQIIFIILLI